MPKMKKPPLVDKDDFEDDNPEDVEQKGTIHTLPNGFLDNTSSTVHIS